MNAEPQPNPELGQELEVEPQRPGDETRSLSIKKLARIGRGVFGGHRIVTSDAPSEIEDIKPSGEVQ